MLCEIYIFATHDLIPQEEFPHEHSAWADGDPVSTYRKGGDLSRQKYDGIEQVRTVTSEGLQSPVHGFLRVNPPKYPPHQLTGYDCDSSIIGPVENHAQIIVYAIDCEDYDSLPEAMQGMRPDDPIKEEVWERVRDGLINVSPAENQEQVASWLNGWRRSNPLGTARDFAIEDRKFTS